MRPNIGEAISRAETHNAAKAEYDRSAALRIKLGAEIPSEDMTAQAVPGLHVMNWDSTGLRPYS
jgi:hypothetical protein